MTSWYKNIEEYKKKKPVKYKFYEATPPDPVQTINHTVGFTVANTGSTYLWATGATASSGSTIALGFTLGVLDFVDSVYTFGRFCGGDATIVDVGIAVLLPGPICLYTTDFIALGYSSTKNK